MLNVITIAFGVALGMIMATAFTFALLCNKKVVAWYTKWTMRTALEVGKEIIKIDEEF